MMSRTISVDSAAIHRPAPAPAPPMPSRIIGRITAAVAAHYAVPLAIMTSEMQTAHVALARQTAMALARELHGYSLPRIGRAFRRDHSTVLHAVTKIAALRRTDPVYAAQFDALALTLSEMEA